LFKPLGRRHSTVYSFTNFISRIYCTACAIAGAALPGSCGVITRHMEAFSANDFIVVPELEGCIGYSRDGRAVVGRAVVDLTNPTGGYEVALDISSDAFLSGFPRIYNIRRELQIISS